MTKWCILFMKSCAFFRVNKLQFSFKHIHKELTKIKQKVAATHGFESIN